MRKLLEPDDLAGALAAAREQGKKVVLCHGVFDVVHLGHIRHLELARAEGDILVVSVTADAFVNKGPGRPVFTERLRAEMLAAMEIVDWVVISHSPSAIPIIEAAKPDVYVKGNEYQNAEDDITGKIRLEQAAVELWGGRIVFTHDIVFSSSNLINRYLDVHDPELRDYLERISHKGAYQRILELVNSIEDHKVVMVGDAIIDEYVYVEPLGKPSKEHIVSTLYKDRELFAGGIVAAANHAAGFCREVEVVTLLGGGDADEALVREALRPNVTLHAIKIEGRPTTRKTRYLSDIRKLFEVYTMDDSPLDPADRERFDRLVRERCAEANSTVVADFGHGAIAGSTIDLLTTHSRFLAVNVQTNSGNQGFNLATRYSRADYVCIDAPEARLAVGDKFGEVKSDVIRELSRRIACDRFAITHGASGCYVLGGESDTIHVPAFTKTVVDTIGAGDAFFAVTAPLVAVGGSMEDVGIVGNASGAIKVGIVGHRNSVAREALLKYLAALLK